MGSLSSSPRDSWRESERRKPFRQHRNGDPWRPKSAMVFVAGLGTLWYNINQVSLRQSLVPVRIQGRLNATMRFLVWGTIPIGSLLGGALGEIIGVYPAIVLAAVGGLSAVPWVFFSPV